MKLLLTSAATIVAISGCLLWSNTALAATKPAKKEDAKPLMAVVEPGDTLTSIAEAHQRSFVELYNANESLADPNIINVGQEIRIPAKDEELADRYSTYQATTAPSVSYEANYSQVYTPGSQPVYATDSAGNTYFKGYCTWYAKSRRPDLPNRLGNGGQWTANAARQGFNTGSTPQAGAIAERAGHVAYVESVNPDGTITVSDMNGGAGFGAVGKYTVPSSNYSSYIY